MNQKLSRIALAVAAARLFAVAGCASEPATQTAKGHCSGVNACKGTSACKTAKNACKCQNACKAQGFMVMTQAECKAAGGQFQSDGG
jgi:hypothetical protein